jgi:hypothetical protein
MTRADDNIHRRLESSRQTAQYFLNGGVAPITTVLSDGRTVEAATVGHDVVNDKTV